MIDEQLARLRVHGNNIHRYRRLLKGNLTDHEREFIEGRLSEEQSAILRLTTERITIYEALTPEERTFEEFDAPVKVRPEISEPSSTSDKSSGH